MTTAGLLSTLMDAPIARSSRPNERVQRSSEMMTTLPATASSSVKVRPRSGRAPTTSSEPGVTSELGRTVRPASVWMTSVHHPNVPPTASKMPLSFQARQTAQAGLLYDVFVAKIHVREAVGILERDRPQKQRIEHAERRGRESNRQRQHRDGDPARPQFQLPGRVAQIVPEGLDQRDAIQRIDFFELCARVAEREPRLAAGNLRRSPARDQLVRVQVEVGAHLLSAFALLNLP